VDNKNLEIEGH